MRNCAITLTLLILITSLLSFKCKDQKPVDIQTLNISPKKCSSNKIYRFPKLVPVYLAQGRNCNSLQAPISIIPRRDPPQLLLSYENCDPRPPHWLRNCSLTQALAPYIFLLPKHDLPFQWIVPRGFTSISHLSVPQIQESMLGPHIEAIYAVKVRQCDSIWIYHGDSNSIDLPNTEVYILLGFKEASPDQKYCPR